MQEWSIYVRKGLTFIPTCKFYHMREYTYRGTRTGVYIQGYTYRGTPALHVQTSLCWRPCSEAEVSKIEECSYV